MKVLLTTHQFFPEYTAGTEVLTLSVARELRLRGHEVRIYTGQPSGNDLKDEERFDEYEFEGIHVYRFHHAYTPMGGQNSLIEIGYDNQLAAAHFARILQSFTPGVVHLFHLNRLGTGLIEKAVQSAVPASMTVTDFWPICPTGQLMMPNGELCVGPNRYAGNCIKHFAQSSRQSTTGNAAKWIPVAFINLLSRITTSYGCLPRYPRDIEVRAMRGRLEANVYRLNQLEKILVPTSLMRELLVKNGVNPDLIVESAFGIDIQNCKSGTRVPHQPLRIGYIGTLARHKGCHVLIDALNALPPQLAALKIYGNPEDFPDYYEHLQTMPGNSADIEFCGTFPNSRIAEVLNEIDVLVVPSIWYENTPLVIHSAQAVRCPIVASNLQGISAVIGNEKNGLLFKPGNAADLAGKLLRLINEPTLLPKLSANALQPKSISVYVDELLNIWKAP